MEPNAPVSFADLLDAFLWVSSGGLLENEAYVSRRTGIIHWITDAVDDNEPPEDLDDDSVYVAVPHQSDLDLGRSLALRFAAERLPDDQNVIASFFRQRGAYGQLKDFLDRRGRLQEWYDYENAAIESALREWCHGEGLQLKE
jgi:hypothetical protein